MIDFQSMFYTGVKWALEEVARVMVEEAELTHIRTGEILFPNWL